MLRRPLIPFATVLLILLASSAMAQLVDADTLYTSGSMSFDYVQTPFPNYSGSFSAEGEGLNEDGTLPPGVIEAVGGGSALALEDTVATVIYGVTDNEDGTYDGSLIFLKTVGPLTAGTYPVDLENGTATFGFIDDAESLDLPDTLDFETVYQWLIDLPAYHKLVGAAGSIEIAGVSADTLYGSFNGQAADIENFFFLVNFTNGEFNLSGEDVVASVPPVVGPEVRAWPNPFNPQTSVFFSLPQAQQVDVAVYDLAGRRVRTLHRGQLDDGEQRLTWNGCDDGGMQAPAGVYMVRVQGAEWRDSVKVLLVP